MSIYDQLRERNRKLWTEHGLLSEKVQVSAFTLTSEEAIGNPEADDFPLQKGKERLMQAEFFSGKGQAFTDRYGDFSGLLSDILDMPLGNNFRRAVFIATINAVLNFLDRIQKTTHCRDHEPSQCALELASYIMQQYGQVKVAQVGFQPRMVESLSSVFDYRLLDLDPDHIGTRRFGIPVEGPDNTNRVLAWADLLLVTGTTLVNGTIDQFLISKPILFYGTTIAGAAYLMNWDRFCGQGL